MRPLDSRDILWAWEAGLDTSAARRALILLAAASPETDWEELAQLPLGQRQARLLWVREHTLGPSLEVYVECPGCAGQLEFELDCREERTADLTDATMDQTFEISVDDIVLELRLPSTADLLAVESMADASHARREIFVRCLAGAQRRGDPLDVDILDDEVVDRASDALAELDPQGDDRLELECPLCGHAWWASFDIAVHLWRELEVEARRLLREIDVLAAAYGWTEDEILALSPFRRRCYVELITS